MNAMLLLTLSAGMAAAEPDDTKSDLPKLQGIWKVTAMESRGMAQQPPQQLIERYTLVVVGDSYVFSTHAGTMKPDAAKKALDLAVTDGRYKDKPVLGLYEVTGDTLKIAIGTPLRGTDRPTEMKTGENTTFAVYTFTREKATKEQAEAKLKELKTALPATAPGFGGPGVGRTPATDRATQELLKQVLDKLDRIEKRLDAMEKKEKENK